MTSAVRGDQRLNNYAFLETLYAILSDTNRKAAFLALCDFYASGTDEQRVFIRKNYPFGEKWETPHIIDYEEQDYSSRSSDRWPFYSDLPRDLPDEAPAVRRVRAALIWLSIKGGSGDIRDDGLTMVLIYYAAKEIGIDTDALFSEIAAISGQEPVSENPHCMLREQMGYWFHNYVGTDKVVSLKEMGFAKQIMPDGTRFSPIDM